MRKILAVAVVFITGITCGLIFTYGPLHAQGSVDEGSVMAKLDEIARSQAEMTASLNSMKEDLQVIKVRITQMQ
jgi:hypothetical protein